MRTYIDHGETLECAGEWIPKKAGNASYDEALRLVGLAKAEIVAPPAPSLDAVKAARKAELAVYRYGREAGGITLNGSAIHTDRESQALVSGAFQLVQAAPETVIDWKGSGGWVQLDAATMTAIAMAVATHVQACFSAEKAHAEAIDACGSVEEVAAYDISAGWPE